MREIPGFPGYLATPYGDIYSTRQGHLRKLKQRLCDGYFQVNVKTAPGRHNMKTRYVHHLVLLAYGAPRPTPSHVGMHRDGSRTNNRESNLSWGTQHQNIHDAIAQGTHISSLRGERHPNAKLSNAAVAQIKMIASSDRAALAALASSNSVSLAHVCAIARGAPGRR